jgi:hypothetical protein
MVSDQTVFVSSNLNEEENQNSSIKYNGEKQIVYSNIESLFSILLNNKKVAHSIYLLGSSNYTLDIILPPPEYL